MISYPAKRNEQLVSGEGHFTVLFGLSAKRLLKRRKLRFDASFELSALDDVLPITAKEVIDCFNANANGPGWFVLVEILK